MKQWSDAWHFGDLTILPPRPAPAAATRRKPGARKTPAPFDGAARLDPVVRAHAALVLEGDRKAICELFGLHVLGRVHLGILLYVNLT